MKNDWIVLKACIFKLFSNNCKAVKVKLSITLKLICTMACTNSYSKGINACTLYKIKSLVRVCICSMSFCNTYFVFYTSKLTKFSLNYNTMSMSVVYNFFSLCYIFFIVIVRTIKHYRCKAVFNTKLNCFEVWTMIKMKSYINTCFFCNSCYHIMHTLWTSIL